MDSNTKISIKKQYESFKNKAERQSIPGHCRICGKGLKGGLCNSHSIPQCILKQIPTSNGHVYCQSFADCDFTRLLLGPEKGLNKCGVFHLICSDCDQQIFSEYENIEKLQKITLSPFSPYLDSLLNLIFLKTNLLELYKKTMDGHLYNNLVVPDSMLYCPPPDDLNVRDFNQQIDYAVDCLSKAGNNYYLVHGEYLNHKVPLASQCLITLQENLNGKLINDPFNYNPDYHLADLCLTIFPLPSSTLVLLFCPSYDRERLQPFITYFSELKESSKLKLLQGMLLAYSEEVYMNKETYDAISSNPVANDFQKKGISKSIRHIVDGENLTDLFQHEYIQLNGFRKLRLIL